MILNNMKKQILSVLPGDHPWQKTLICYDTIPSTNDLAKEMARNGAPEGTVIVSTAQTAGRGRLGRSFHAPAGLGLYFSVILRPLCPPEQLLHLTCAAAVAACNAVENCTGKRPQIKWTNDLVIGKEKLGGILTELSVSQAGTVDWAVIGIGINCLHRKEDFPAELQSIATSLLLSYRQTVSPGCLAAYLIQELYPMRQMLFSQQDSIMQSYKQDCMTLGQQVVLVRGEEKRYGTALDLDRNGALIVKFEDGTVECVQSGEISVRGLYGYV